MNSLQFAEMARRLGAATRHEGFEVPGFRSPPRSPLLVRSIGRHQDGSVTVSVRLQGRASTAVTADLIDGVIVANEVGGAESSLLRDALWLAAEEVLLGGSGQAVAETKPLAA